MSIRFKEVSSNSAEPSLDKNVYSRILREKVESLPTRIDKINDTTFSKMLAVLGNQKNQQFDTPLPYFISGQKIGIKCVEVVADVIECILDDMTDLVLGKHLRLKTRDIEINIKSGELVRVLSISKVVEYGDSKIGALKLDQFHSWIPSASLESTTKTPELRMAEVRTQYRITFFKDGVASIHKSLMVSRVEILPDGCLQLHPPGDYFSDDVLKQARKNDHTPPTTAIFIPEMGVIQFSGRMVPEAQVKGQKKTPPDPYSFSVAADGTVS